jgi:LysR family transcriptional regulator of gallate degradation
MLDPAPFLAAVMETFTKSNPDCSIRVVNSTYDDLLQRVRLGLVDFIVGVLRDGSPDLHTRPLFADPYVVAGRRGHPLAGLDRVTADELLQYDWIVPNPGAPRRKAFDQFFREAEPARRAPVSKATPTPPSARPCARATGWPS